VDTAHACGIGVLLDVVYNHLGPDGNFLSRFSKDYFSARYSTDWGEAINFDGDNSGPVREYFLTNAAYWIAEFHLDGLRLMPPRISTTIARHTSSASSAA
jgi:maltooligosyltrehalose trehalohydrolase